jgi:hypothetical protein
VSFLQRIRERETLNIGLGTVSRKEYNLKKAETRSFTSALINLKFSILDALPYSPE